MLPSYANSQKMVPEVGIEPTLPKERNFESGALTIPTQAL